MWLVTEYDEIIPCREWVFESKKEAEDFVESKFDPEIYWVKFDIEKVQWMVEEYDNGPLGMMSFEKWFFSSEEEALDFVESVRDPEMYWLDYKIEKVQ